ncbi:bifunctional riboflavin kinase/FAD synthetase [Corynebacterium bovis]|uniref:bifunctional riboflavin kinase/FAD synthetase n=1 Tax=Corynebacterium bovis TaxID=36808 RepID=UPI000F65536E|nr:bifunctional riboflavin kinase/FAD synthetase [Corynebacterium bovis]RRQ14345.1 bifunctional riboflavin kinase/FAD synthetase [Corynebacterium bovis]
MDIWHGLDSVPSDLTGSVVTIGVFDGVHRGHRELISRAVTAARSLGVPAVMCTFDPHPTEIFSPDRVPPLLGTVAQRAALAGEAGIDAAVVISFDDEISSWSPAEYVDRVLVDALHARAVVVGANFTFGHRASGTPETLVELGRERGIDVTVVDLLTDSGAPAGGDDAATAAGAAAGAAGDGGDGAEADGSGSGDRHVVCSTWIRGRLAAGDVEGAAEALGRDFDVVGEVVHGAGRGGAELGFPTANLYLDERYALPADGVYAGYLRILPDPEAGVDAGAVVGTMPVDVDLPAAVSVGSNPTFGDARRSVEAFVLDHHADLYGRRVRVRFTGRVRGMVAFSGVDELMDAIARDVAQVRGMTVAPTSA